MFLLHDRFTPIVKHAGAAPERAEQNIPIKRAPFYQFTQHRAPDCVRHR